MRKSKEFVVENFLVNSDGFLKMKYLFGLMFETSFDQAEEVEDKDIMKGKSWVVYSWDIKIKKPIKARDRIEITTFAIDMNKFYAYRNFIIKRKKEVVALAYCVFLLFDINKKRTIKLPKPIIEDYGKEEAVYIEKKQKYNKNFNKAQKIYIRKNDIDQNLHVNNASYMDLIREISDIKDQDIGYINLVYRNEIRNKKYVLGQKATKDDEESIRLTDEEGKIYTYGKIRRIDV